MAGIGPARRKALLKQFGSIEGIKEASIEEIAAIPGINEALAIAVKSGLE
ncbi:MAG: helix-hairpin-helix domain-containing protein [bacterium]